MIEVGAAPVAYKPEPLRMLVGVCGLNGFAVVVAHRAHAGANWRVSILTRSCEMAARLSGQTMLEKTPSAQLPPG